MIKKLQTWLFYALVFLLPLNLGKHFIISESYAKTYLIDYLVPVVWATDLLLIVILILWAFSGGLRKVSSQSYFRFILLFVASLLPSVAVAARFIPALFAFVSLLLHVGLVFFITARIPAEKYFGKIVKLLSISVLLLSALAFFQWQKQSSVFNNYLIFGEQPYGVFTENIALTSFLGSLKIPVYGTFRHPNVFGGFLAVALLWIYSQLVFRQREWRGEEPRPTEPTGVLPVAAFVLGTLALVLTFSKIAVAALVLGIAFLHVIKKLGKKGVILSLAVTAAIFLTGLFLPIFPKEGFFTDDPSIYRRSNLERSAYKMLNDNTTFGVGLNNFTARVDDYLPSSQLLRFTQPTHNIFVLLFAESGIFALTTFLALLAFVIVTLLQEPFGTPAVLFVTVLQFFIIGSFDHYLLTIQQTQLLFWLTVGLALTYTKKDVEV